MRRCLVLLALLCLLPPAHGDGAGHEAFHERVLEGALGPMDLHGTRLAWAALRDGQVELVVTDLEDGAEFTATRVPVDGEKSIPSLAFDGRWIAWTDDRYGNLDAFAIDTDTGRLLRLSEHPLDDRDIDVADGRFAWVRGGVLLADDTGQVEAVGSSGAAFEPAFAGGWLVWSQIEQTRRVIRGQYLADGSLHTLADNEGVVHKDLEVSPGRIIWSGWVGDQARIYTRSLHADGSAGETSVLTDWGPFEGVWSGGGHGSWVEKDSRVLHVERFSDGRASTTRSDLDPLLSDMLLVLPAPDAAGIQVVSWRWETWDARLPGEASDPRPFLIAAGVALLAGGAGLQWWRARRQGGA